MIGGRLGDEHSARGHHGTSNPAVETLDVLFAPLAGTWEEGRETFPPLQSVTIMPYHLVPASKYISTAYDEQRNGAKKEMWLEVKSSVISQNQKGSQASQKKGNTILSSTIRIHFKLVDCALQPIHSKDKRAVWQKGNPTSV